MNPFQSLAKILIVIVLVSGCSGETTETSNQAATTTPGPDPLEVNRDTTIKPGDDFFHYAHGTWFKTHPIPESESRNGLWRMIGDTINAQIRKVCESSAADKSAAKGSNKQKIGDFYASGMDTVAIDKAGISPLKKELDAIESVTDLSGLLKQIAHLHTIGVPAAFNAWVSQDDKISHKHAIFFSQGGLGLGEREYYFKEDARTAEIRNVYQKHIQRIFELAGDDAKSAQDKAASVFKLEKNLAQNSRKMAELRDPVKNYNKMGLDKFNQLTPSIDWNSVAAGLGISKLDTVIVGQPEFYSALNTSLGKFSLSDWKNYLRWNLLNAYAEYLSSDFEKQNFYFFSTVINGVKQQKPRWKRVVETTNGQLGELIGQVYVTEYLPKGTKEKLLEIGNAIREVYAERIQKLDWMGEETKKKALNKLSKIVMKVGYPDKWKDLGALTVSRDNWCQNMINANAWHFNYMMNKFGKPVDRTEWSMYPQTYNAYYNPSNNEIVVPACNIIVPGFEGRMPDDAILYSIIGGSTFGHEITHGFDDQGAQYDENGNLNNWWTAEDLKKFKTKTGAIVKQYSEYKIGELNINGDATQGENIADLGGVVMGYEAFRKTEQYKKGEKIAGLTPDERYFLGYAYAWMVNSRPESIQRQIMTDVHSPVQYRVNGPLANMPEFHKTFGVKEGDALFRSGKDLIVIW